MENIADTNVTSNYVSSLFRVW